MISSDREYKITKAAISSFEKAISAFDIFGMVKQGIDPVLARAQLVSYERQLKELVKLVQEYDAIRSGAERQFPITDIRDIGTRLIAARIAKGWTQRQLAEELGLKEQQIQRYEREKYESTSLKRLALIVNALGVEIAGSFLLGSEAKGSRIQARANAWQAINPSLFPIKEMNSRRWFNEHLDLRSTSEAQQKRALYTFLFDSGYDLGSVALHRRTLASQNAKTSSALMAWQARILGRARELQASAGEFRTLSPAFVKELVATSREENGPLRAVEMLKEHGIIVVFERHFSQTYLDGAAIALGSQNAVIGMSLRHDRLDNFWYVLLHEMGHIAKHWGPLLRKGFIDEDVNDLFSSYEKEADEFARNSIISDTVWDSSFIKYTKSRDEVLQFANRHNVSPALIAGRLRRERNDYRTFSDLVGNGCVRCLFEKAGMYEGEGK